MRRDAGAFDEAARAIACTFCRADGLDPQSEVAGAPAWRGYEPWARQYLWMLREADRATEPLPA